MNDTIEQTAEELEAIAKLRDIRSRKALGVASSIVFHVRSMAERTDGRSERGIAVAKESTPLPSQIVDDADEVYVRLLEWTSFWHSQLGGLPPAAAPVAWRSFDFSHKSTGYRDAQILGFKSGTNPAGARSLVQLQTMWLLDRADRIAATNSAEVYQDDVSQMVGAIRAHYPTSPAPEKPAVPHACPECGMQTLTAEWTGPQIDEVSIRCAFCGYQVPTPRATDIERWIARKGDLKVISQECEALDHAGCSSLDCGCECHTLRETRLLQKAKNERAVSKRNPEPHVELAPGRGAAAR